MDTGRQTLPRQMLLDILEHIYNEVYVIDRDLTILYVNSACTKHYGLLPGEMIGRNHMEFVGNLWYPTIIPRVLEERRTLRVEQVTYTGESIVATATPVLDDSGEIDMIVCVTEEQLQSVDIRYNPVDQVVSYAKDACVSEPTQCHGMNGESPQMRKLLRLAAQCAQRDASVLIQGETGTGKTLLAKYIHQASRRSNGPFTVLNCAAVPANLLEVELFGCAPNAFTDAPPRGKCGLFEMADGGTLFLDEVGELPLALQAKLLGVLESKRFTPVGATREQTADVRILSATNRPLLEMIAHQQFREDLYWRLNVVDLLMPPLRERPEQIVPLAQDFLARGNQKYGGNRTMDEDVLWAMERYSWPGNIRQLKSVVECMLVTSAGLSIVREDLPLFLRGEKAGAAAAGNDYEQFHKSCEARIVRDAMQAGAVTTRQLAEVLQISQSTANRLMQKYSR